MALPQRKMLRFFLGMKCFPCGALELGVSPDADVVSSYELECSGYLRIVV